MAGAAFAAYVEPPLTDGLVVLRPWRDGDLPCIEAASADPYIPQFTSIPPVYDAAEGRAFIARQRQLAEQGSGLALAIATVADDRAVGNLTVLPRSGFQAGAVGLGYWVIAAERRRGLAGRAVRLVVPWLRTVPEVERIEALVEPENVASRRVVEAAGLQREGILRAYFSTTAGRVDVVMYGLLPSDPERAGQRRG